MYAPDTDLEFVRELPARGVPKSRFCCGSENAVGGHPNQTFNLSIYLNS